MANDKVELFELLFTLSWEDPELDREAFATGPGARIATVASGGCNALTFLLDDPAEVFAFDYNPTQVWTTELKRVAVRELDDAALYELLGIRSSERRQDLVDTVLAHLPDDARRWWADQAWLVQNGLINGGRYERFVGMFRRLLRLMQGSRTIEALFEERDRDERVRFYDERWNGLLWRLLFRAFFNRTVLSRRGLSPAYFTFDDGSASFAESFERRARHALTELPVRDNPFVAQYTLGRYLDEAHLPAWLRPENLATIRDRVDRLKVVVGDVRDVFDSFAEGAFDAICLSNVCELMSEEETAAVLPGIARALRAGGRMTLRNLMIPRAAPASLTALVPDEALSRALRERDRSFVYRAVHVYTRSTDPT